MWKPFAFLKRKRKQEFASGWGSWSAILDKHRNPKWLGNKYQTLALEGYIKNVIAFRAINSIGWAASAIPFFVKIGGNDVDENNEVIRWLKMPNPMQGYKDFIKVLVMHRMVSGNAYILKTQASTGRFELALLRPDRVEIESTSGGIPIAYKYTINGVSEKFPIDPITLKSDVLHIKEPNPLDDLYGLSPIRAAALGICQHNESSKWNQKLLENSANPTGVMVLKESGNGAIPPKDKQLKEISDKFNSKYAGPDNAGKIPFISFDMRFEKMGMSPKDMDWINGRNTSARDIALALGYPPHLLGMAEGSTFNNVAEAKLSLYQETVIPIIQSTLEALSRFISTDRPKEIEIVPDLDSVDALAPMREKVMEQTRLDYEAGGITLNEFREARGYDPMPNGDDVLVPAGKLPLSFDPGTLDDEQFSDWLVGQGLTTMKAKEIVQLSSQGN